MEFGEGQGGTPVKRLVMIDPPGFVEPDDLNSWVDLAVLFTSLLPPRAK